MEKNINNFITINRQKNGKMKITQTDNNVGNIYKLLHEIGYCKTKLDNKSIYFLRKGIDIVPITFSDIKDAFLNILKDFEFTNIPEDIEYTTILNWYYEKLPIKENGLTNLYLNDTLTDLEIHKYKLVTDYSYIQEFEVNQLLTNFNKWAFIRTVDEIGTFCKGSQLYYKNIGDNKYLIFSYINSLGKTKGYFDCWIATFTNNHQIGNNKPISLQDIRQGFKLNRDFELIKEYLN
jgi:hypothetical protein